MTEDKNRQSAEEESITHFPFPNIHLFLVTESGVPVGELRLEPVANGDTRVVDAILDVNRFTGEMTRMTASQLGGLHGRLSGLLERCQELINRLRPENGNGASAQLAEKPSVPPEEPTPPASADAICPHCREALTCTAAHFARVVCDNFVPAPLTPEAPQAVVAAPPAPPAPQPVVLPHAQPARARRPRAPRRSAAERAAAVAMAAVASDSARMVSDSAHRIFEEIQAGREQEAESDMVAARAQGAPAPLPTPPARPATASAPAAAPHATAPAAVPPAPTTPPAVALPSTAPSAMTAPTTATAPPPPASQHNAPTSPPAPARPPQPATRTPVATPATTTPVASASAPSTSAPTPAPSSSPAPAASTTIEGKVLAAIASGPKSFGQLSMETGGTSREIFGIVKRLLDAGKIRKVDQSYRLPE